MVLASHMEYGPDTNRKMAEKTDKKKILLVEDTIFLAETYKEYLRDEPYEIVCAETGKEAYAALEECMPDAILLDIILPDINGLEILKHIAENEIPIEIGRASCRERV